MRPLVLALLVVVTTFGFLKRIGWLPDAAPFLTEIFGAIVVAYVALVGTQDRFRYVAPIYWFFFAAIAVVMLCGAIVNQVQPGPLVSGMRTYLKAVPFFFLPAVCRFDSRHVVTQLRLLGLIAVLQLPIALSQRLENMSRGGSTGDTTSGTLLISSIMSIFQIFAVTILLALAFRGIVRVRVAVLLFLLIIFPTTINETKGTLVLLPVAVCVTFLVGAKPGARLKAVLLTLVSIAAFLIVFIPVYDHLIQSKEYGTPIAEFLTQEGRVEGYLVSGAEIGDTEDVRRGDMIVVPLRFVSQEATRFVFGVGIGNGSRSQLGDGFSGRYFSTIGPFLGTSFGLVTTELGMLGLVLVMLLHLQLFRDAKIVARANSELISALALGWCGVVVVMSVAFFYKNVILYDALSVPFWYLSGVIAAERMHLAHVRPERGADGLRRGPTLRRGGMAKMDCDNSPFSRTR